MPYISISLRNKLENFPEAQDECRGKILVLAEQIDSEGELNYVITRLCHEFARKKGIKYAVYNTIIGVLECAKLELYRKWIAPYEEEKEKANGPVN
jgi:hypothetical protein